MSNEMKNKKRPVVFMTGAGGGMGSESFKPNNAVSGSLRRLRHVCGGGGVSASDLLQMWEELFYAMRLCWM